MSTGEIQEERDLVPPYWVTAMVTRRQEGPDRNFELGRDYVLQGWILKRRQKRREGVTDRQAERMRVCPGADERVR